jgi:signal transduction histidine kinase
MPAKAADAASTGQRGDSIFEASAFERALGPQPARGWLGWRRRALVLAALLGCLALLALARWLAATPHIEANWSEGAGGTLVLQASPLAALADRRGHALVAIVAADGQETAVDALLLQRAPRWLADDAARQRQAVELGALAASLHDAAGLDLRLRFDDGVERQAPVRARGLAGLGVAFWPLSALALLLYLFGVVLVAARAQPRNLLYGAMCALQAANLGLMALEHAPGWPAAGPPLGLAWRGALDLATGAAVVHAYVLHPLRLRHAGLIAAAAWSAVGGWLLLCRALPGVPLWWALQGGCLALSVAAWAVIARSHRIEPNPYALVMRRYAVAVFVALVACTGAVAAAQSLWGPATPFTADAALLLYVAFALLLLLTPFLARSPQLLREFALLAAVSTAATALDLLFVATFSLEPFTSLAIAVFSALGLYAWARQWLIGRFIGSRLPTTERTFEQLYRAAREVQAHPVRYPQQLALLLRELFDPLELKRVDRVPQHARVVGGGAALVVPLRAADEEPAVALVLRYAQRGQRLFAPDDARLADRIVFQLRRAVAYDQAVERGRTEERQRIAQDLHDDIGARLLTLMYQAPTPELENYIRHTLQDLKTLTRGLAAAEHRLSHAAAEWKADLTQRLTAAHVGLGWSFHYDRDMRLSMVQWSALTRVLRELVSNALAHGQAAHIDVAFHLQGGRLTLSVADDGIGRAPQNWSHGLGLGGVRKRVKLLGGTVAWQENEPRGIVCALNVADFSGRD